MRSLSLLDLAFVAPKGLPPQNIPGDDFEIYTNGIDMDGLNMGWCGNHLFDICWSTDYAAKNNFAGIQDYDDMESYADGANVNGLNGGNGFTEPYVVH